MRAMYKNIYIYNLRMFILLVFNLMDWVNLTQMTIISTTVGKNPLEEME